MLSNLVQCLYFDLPLDPILNQNSNGQKWILLQKFELNMTTNNVIKSLKTSFFLEEIKPSILANHESLWIKVLCLSVNIQVCYSSSDIICIRRQKILSSAFYL